MGTVLLRAGAGLLIVAMLHLPVWAAPDAAEIQRGRMAFDTGVFLYESGDFDKAGERFRQAIATDGANPYYNYYLARVYMEQQEYAKAVVHLDRARSSDQKIPGLDFDWAMVHYRLADYATAGRLFDRVSAAEPNNALSRYYAGISQYQLYAYEDAIALLQEAGAMNRSVKPNAAFYIGMCHKQLGDTGAAMESLAYAAENATDRETRNAAASQLSALSRQQRQAKPYTLMARLETKYNNNVLLEPVDNEALFNDESDWAFTGILSGSYDVVRANEITVGAGYTHYQSWYADLGQYDLTGSLFDIYARYRKGDVLASLSYRPAYFWMNEESYLMRHEIRPSVTAKLRDNLMASLTYAYKRDNDMLDNGRDGHINEMLARMIYSMPDNRGDLMAGLGYLVNSASHNDYDYDMIKTEVAARLYLPWQSRLILSGECRFREHDHTDSIYGVVRDDTRYRGSLGVEKDLYRDIISAGAGYMYTDNDSNIANYKYRSHEFRLFLSARI
ncbi:tetratricopeptide repeat protein [Desulfosudis oleivorans]|uniref:Tetratricopeptide TPR_2 repeat protein n=1 Tax=Desulfosudis oleivorans (strain DSM 6200 / JCM 39069 / Hxd3) TaxID=96561 RepID=A8ZSC0_DESOH|nr:tetratricopeptide repeat protein [Desulfosudis oleivorans]ABW67657.1 Tetratricopeptide TPR_2 repeat protein [Desulfosudis oleivorans Hxd3]